MCRTIPLGSLPTLLIGMKMPKMTAVLRTAHDGMLVEQAQVENNTAYEAVRTIEYTGLGR